jgi:release factor glutamine methyltransferase
MSTPLSATSGSWLNKACRQLENAGISTARLDALVILEDCLGKDRALVLAHPEQILSAVQLNRLNKQLKQRAKHIPLAYIRQKSEFYGRDFFVDKRVLEPRPETETMIDLFDQLPIEDNTKVADVGTGSGCIGITIQLENPKLKVDLYDIDRQALAVARLNTKRFKIKVKCYQADLLEPNHGPYQVILANLPYVPASYHINAEALIEPHRAIFGGQDGLDIYRQLFHQINSFNWQPNYIMTEALPFQHKLLEGLAKRNQYLLINTSDFIQCYEKF